MTSSVSLSLKKNFEAQRERAIMDEICFGSGFLGGLISAAILRSFTPAKESYILPSEIALTCLLGSAIMITIYYFGSKCEAFPSNRLFEQGICSGIGLGFGQTFVNYLALNPHAIGNAVGNVASLAGVGSQAVSSTPLLDEPVRHVLSGAATILGLKP
jgi:hypothetical protein